MSQEWPVFAEIVLRNLRCTRLAIRVRPWNENLDFETKQTSQCFNSDVSLKTKYDLFCPKICDKILKYQKVFQTAIGIFKHQVLLPKDVEIQSQRFVINNHTISTILDGVV